MQRMPDSGEGKWKLSCSLWQQAKQLLLTTTIPCNVVSLTKLKKKINWQLFPDLNSCMLSKIVNITFELKWQRHINSCMVMSTTNIPPFFLSLFISHLVAAEFSPIWTNPILPSVVPKRISSPVEKSLLLFFCYFCCSTQHTVRLTCLHLCCTALRQMEGLGLRCRRQAQIPVE